VSLSLYRGHFIYENVFQIIDEADYLVSLSACCEACHLSLYLTVTISLVQIHTAGVPCAPARFDPTHHSGWAQHYSSHTQLPLHFPLRGPLQPGAFAGDPPTHRI